MLISDIEKLTGLPAKTIRYYEERGLITIKRGENGYRRYDERDLELLSNIRAMRQVGIPVADIKLWTDRVVTRDELLQKRLRSIDDDSKKSAGIKAICLSLLGSDKEIPELIDARPFVENETWEPSDRSPILLGIDIGTTSISAQVVSASDGKCVQTCSIDHNAGIVIDNMPDAFAADANALIGRAASLISSLCGTYKNISAIGVTGQMHGIICVGKDFEILSPLYTWQNGFGLRKTASGKTVCGSIEEKCSLSIPTGYGIVTFTALREFGMLPENTVKISTAADLLVSKLCGCALSSHPTNAASLGAFDIDKNEFDPEALRKLDIPRSLLPLIAKDYETAGYYICGGRKIPVSCAVGDNQAGVFGSLSDKNSLLINVGTSSQVSFVTDAPEASAGEIRPYFDSRYLLSGAALCGGRAYSMLKDMIRSVLESFGYEASDKQIYAYLNSSALGAPDTGLKADTRFCGSRSDPYHKGSIMNIGQDNLRIGDIASAVLAGIIDELYELYAGMNRECAERGTVVSGNAMRRNAALREICSKRFKKEPLVPLHREEAAFGAALFAGISSGIISRDDSYKMIKYESGKDI